MATWSKPVSITPQIKRPEWRLCFDGPGNGIQTRNGTLVMPAQFKDAGGKPYSCFIFSRDGGKTWAQHDLKELGKRSPTRLHEKNGDGWFRMDLRKGWIDRAEVLFLKPKSA